jgi:thiol-disulfide isomerase/thioredoxin
MNRWVLAAVSALALALLTLNLPLPWAGHSDLVEGDDSHAAGATCPEGNKPANLDFTVQDMHGKDVRLADYKGKVVLLDFWATWCGPCKVEIPWFIEFQEKYGAQGLQVLGVSVDDTPDKLMPYVAAMKMNYPVLQGRGRDDLQDAFGPIWGIPVTAVISREGKICSKHTGLSKKEAFEQEIKSLL